MSRLESLRRHRSTKRPRDCPHSGTPNCTPNQFTICDLPEEIIPSILAQVGVAEVLRCFALVSHRFLDLSRLLDSFEFDSIATDKEFDMSGRGLRRGLVKYPDVKSLVLARPRNKGWSGRFWPDQHLFKDGLLFDHPWPCNLDLLAVEHYPATNQPMSVKLFRNLTQNVLAGSNLLSLSLVGCLPKFDGELSDDLTQLFKAVSSCQQLEYLDLSYNKDIGYALGSLKLEAMPNLKLLDLNRCYLTYTAVEDLAKQLGHSKRLQVLDLSLATLWMARPDQTGTFATNAGVKLMQALHGLDELRELYLNSCGLGCFENDPILSAFCKVAPTLTGLKAIYVEGNDDLEDAECRSMIDKAFSYFHYQYKPPQHRGSETLHCIRVAS